MSPAMKKAKATATGFPRVSGDEPPPRSRPSGLAAFSPRERG